MKNLTKQQIVSQARTWLGSSFKHQGRVKIINEDDKGGVDCIGLIIGVAKELGISLPDVRCYGRIPNKDYLLLQTQKYLTIKDKNDLEVGDILLFKIDKDPQHFAIVSNLCGGSGIIHSYAPLQAVVEHRLDLSWQDKIVACFKFPTISQD